MSIPIKSCYIAAPSGTNLDLLSAALRRRGISVLVPEHSPSLQIFGEQQNGADLVIGVLTRERRSEWVLFELGQAWALGKRVVLFAPPGHSHLPSTLKRLLVVRANLSNKEAIDFALDQLLAARISDTNSAILSTSKTVLGNEAVKYLEATTGSGAHTSYLIERSVTEALRASGVQILSESDNPALGADLAIWSDGLQSYVGNPLLVEIKAGLTEPKGLAKSAQRLSGQVTMSGGLWGLLLYGGNSPTAKALLPPNVLMLSVSELFERMQAESFDDIVKELRNRRVHGGT